jgi:hypothetical protein
MVSYVASSHRGEHSVALSVTDESDMKGESGIEIIVDRSQKSMKSLYEDKCDNNK